MGKSGTADSNRYCPKCDAEVAKESDKCGRCELARPDDGWPVDELISTVVTDKYRIQRKLGRGGMGAVYLAEQVYEGESLGKVAIKFLIPRGTTEEQDFIRKKFVTEARLARLFNNPHIIKVYDFGIHHDMPYMAMEFLKGETLQDRLLRSRTLDLSETVEVARQTADALSEIHRHDVVHRDIKPENILLLDVKGRDFVKILDFGIAKKIEAGMAAASTQVGTPMYMPPEQIRGKTIDARADIYSLGILIYQCIVGDPPILFDNIYEMYSHQYTAKPPPDIGVARTDLPDDLKALVNAMIHPDPAQRPSSSSEVGEILATMQKQHPELASLPPPKLSDSQGTAVYDSEPIPPPSSVPDPPSAMETGPTIATDSMQQTGTPQPTDYTYADDLDEPGRRSRKGLVAAIIGIVVVLAAGGGVLAYKAVADGDVKEKTGGVPIEVIPEGDLRETPAVESEEKEAPRTDDGEDDVDEKELHLTSDGQGETEPAATPADQAEIADKTSNRKKKTGKKSEPKASKIVVIPPSEKPPTKVSPGEEDTSEDKPRKKSGKKWKSLGGEETLEKHWKK